MAKVEVIEADGKKLDRKKLMNLRIPPTSGSGELRLILPTTSWNTSGKFMTHALDTGAIKKIDNIVEFLEEMEMLDDVVVEDD